MVKLPRFLPLLAALGLLAACQNEPAEETGATEEAAATDAATVRAEIEALGDRFEQALLAEDAATIATFYADHAIALPPGAPRAEGPAAIQALFASWFEMIPASEGFTLTTDDVQLAESGDIAYETGTYTSNLPSLNISLTSGVTVTFGAANAAGWSARVTHPLAYPIQCAMFMGAVPPLAPATTEGQLVCQ